MADPENELDKRLRVSTAMTRAHGALEAARLEAIHLTQQAVILAERAQEEHEEVVKRDNAARRRGASFRVRRNDIIARFERGVELMETERARAALTTVVTDISVEDDHTTTSSSKQKRVTWADQVNFSS